MPAGDPIAELLAGRYPDPDTGELLAAESQAVVIEDSLAGGEDELVAALGVGRRVAVVSDRDTHAALGARIERALGGRFSVQSIVLDDRPRADAGTVTRLLDALAPATELVIAVGSGTLNDLTKMVALRRDCAQAVFATAPSMNGYTSLSASITSDGIKRSYRTRTPRGVFFDLEVLAAAPARLIRAGLGDSACRPTAQADWLLSHLVLDRPYRAAPFALLSEDEHHLFANTRALLAGDLETMRHLVRILVLSGFGMTICNGSYPASQGEHLISHYCTVTMAHVQEAMLRRDRPPVLRPPPIDRAHIVAHFGELIGDACWQEYRDKQLDERQLEAVNARLARDWDAIRGRIDAVRVDAATLTGLLAEAGAPIDPRDLGWPDELFRAARHHAREIRNRYTFLDLEADAR